MDKLQQAIRLEYLSLGWMSIEFIVALITGIQAHSVLLVAFGLDSCLEIISGLVLLWRLTLEKRQQINVNIDMIERRVTHFVGWILILLAIYIVVTSGYNLWTHYGAENSFGGLLISAASLVLMPILALRKVKLGKAIHSPALKEDGMCNVVCAYMALTVLLGVLLTMLFGWWWLTPVAALLLVYFILREGLESIRA